jgi:hypothetical protein
MKRIDGYILMKKIFKLNWDIKLSFLNYADNKQNRKGNN